MRARFDFGTPVGCVPVDLIHIVSNYFYSTNDSHVYIKITNSLFRVLNDSVSYVLRGKCGSPYVFSPFASILDASLSLDVSIPSEDSLQEDKELQDMIDSMNRAVGKIYGEEFQIAPETTFGEHSETEPINDIFMDLLVGIRNLKSFGYTWDKWSLEHRFITRMALFHLNRGPHVEYNCLLMDKDADQVMCEMRYRNDEVHTDWSLLQLNTAYYNIISVVEKMIGMTRREYYRVC